MPRASGNSPDVPLRIGENCWEVRLYGPNGETDTQSLIRNYRH